MTTVLKLEEIKRLIGGGEESPSTYSSLWVKCQSRQTVYGLLLIASNLLMADMARLHTYIRPLELAHVDAGP